MPLNNFALGKNIRHFRKKRGLSQSYLSELIDRSPTYLSYVERECDVSVWTPWSIWQMRSMLLQMLF